MSTEWQTKTNDSGPLANLNSSPLRSSGSSAVCQSCVGPGVGSTTSPEVASPLTSETGKGNIISSRFASPKRNSALKRLCVRALSCEHGDNGQPLMVSEPGLGTAIIVMFELKPHREYMVAYLGDEENDTVKDWPIIAPQLQQVAKTIVSAYEAAEGREEERFASDATIPETSSVTSTGSIPGQPSSESSYGSWISGVSVPSRTFRKPSREAQSLHKLVDDPTIFRQIHGQFAAILSQCSSV